MDLYFKNEDYKQRALGITDLSCKNTHSVEDAFFLLIKSVNLLDLENLCKLIQSYFENQTSHIILSIDECYDLTQGKSIKDKVIFDEKLQTIIYKLAYICLESGNPLGNNTINGGTINTSDWIGHCLFEGKLCGEFAKSFGLDVEKAQKLGLLHDYGRKFIHTAEHITRGFEALSDLGWNEEAIGSLSHSFLAGGRYSWNDPPKDGFYVDDNGVPHFEKICNKDDISLWLMVYKYTDYDYILNVADLMATSHAIVSPAERIDDIATRRKAFDPRNRLFFLAEFTNILINFAKRLGVEIPENMQQEVRASKSVTLEEITKKFEKASDLFWREYQKKIQSSKIEIPKNSY